MSNLRWIPIIGVPKEAAVSLCSEGITDADLADAIGELELFKVRYIVLPTYAHLKAYRAVVNTTGTNKKQAVQSPLESLQEADQVCQLAQIEVDRILSNLMALVQAKVKASNALKLEIESFCEEAKGVMASAMNDINFIAGGHGAHYSTQ